MRATLYSVLTALVLLWGSASYAASLTERTTVADTLTSDMTSGVQKIPAGTKTIYGVVIGTGAVTQTQALYGTVNSTAINGVLLCTLTLSGTTRAQDACPAFPASFMWFYVITTNTTGTGAEGAVYAMY